ncbi:AzlC family ABC transporter permease [Paludifilum halophilum]|uniref:Branched-chain amino acid transporter AzlC n=1 Tax=Paludifilum halophilum TaxID=1642702 RepID=A0A235B4N5_9BACL|nr:AzlC family ABC transporter permease [Paludifilum halophilum]OYD07243.1 branched-chain amino acid transporter AzlC [Paludifilum halophilum]
MELKTHENPQAKKTAFQQGISAAVPIMAGYLPIAITFGVIAQQTGIPLIHSVLMSSLVFAGASQFMAVNMLGAGAGGLEIILATFVLNSRHFVMGLSLMNILRKAPTPWKIALSSGITDETFAVTSLQKEKANPLFAAGLILTSYAAWVSGTLIGGLLSNMIPPSISASMSISLYAMFIGLLVPAVRESWKWGLIALISMGLNTWFDMFLSSGWAIVLATIMGGGIGVPIVRRKKK